MNNGLEKSVWNKNEALVIFVTSKVGTKMKLL